MGGGVVASGEWWVVVASGRRQIKQIIERHQTSRKSPPPHTTVKTGQVTETAQNHQQSAKRASVTAETTKTAENYKKLQERPQITGLGQIGAKSPKRPRLTTTVGRGGVEGAVHKQRKRAKRCKQVQMKHTSSSSVLIQQNLIGD